MDHQFHAKVIAREEMYHNDQGKRFHGCLFQTQGVQANMSSMMAPKHNSLSLSSGGVSPRTV